MEQESAQIDGGVEERSRTGQSPAQRRATVAVVVVTLLAAGFVYTPGVVSVLTPKRGPTLGTYAHAVYLCHILPRLEGVDRIREAIVPGAVDPVRVATIEGEAIAPMVSGGASRAPPADSAG